MVKGGESVNPFTQYMRKILYEEEKKVMGLKINLRFVVPDQGNDIDVGVLEAANELPSEKKIKYDAAKLLTEAKDILDSNINNTINIDDVRYLSGTGFQVGGLAAETISVHLFAPHVYIGVPRYSFQIPANIQSLNGFDAIFEQIMTHIIGMEHQATYIKSRREFFESRRRSFGNHSPVHNDKHTDYVTWTSPSWYPPVNKKSRRSKVPDDNDALQKIMIFRKYVFQKMDVSLSPSSLTPSSSKNAVNYDPGLVDEYGWVPVDGRYYHVEADIYLENHPCNQEVEDSDND